MVSIKSSTWAILLIQLVISCIAIISSVALVVAQAQSLDLNGLAMGPTLHSIFVCFLSFSLLGSSVLAMFGMLSKKPLLLLPIILISIIIFIFHSLLIIQWITSWILLKEKIYDIDLFIIIIGFLLVEFIFILAIYLQIRCYRILQ
uniref:Uncharacterized protein n=1 Tax=Meloidogyne enterolobii TaxID=390850 RepID=A0A6V7TZW2_MELEN|nr:unnamed protein product [Meloidogyne enterolobii]